MSDNQIICPHCLHALRLPTQLEVLRNQHRGGGGYIVISDADELGCPDCGKPIRVQDIISGKHDPKKKGCLGDLADLLGIGIVLAVFALVIAKCSH
jgi:hypothetical protein